MKRCGIILVNWNGGRDTVECLESLFRMDYADYRVIVCDNDSSDGSLELIKSWADGHYNLKVPEIRPLQALDSSSVARPIRWVEIDRATAEAGGIEEQEPPLVLIRTGGNLGFAGGCNVGLRYLLARGDFLFAWLLNNDTVVDPSSLKYLVNECARVSKIGICGSTLLSYDNPKEIQALGGGYYCCWIGLPWLHGRWRRLSPRLLEAGRPPLMMNYVMGASMLVSKDFLEQVGLMREDYFLFFEETDWAWRGRRHFELGWAPRSLVYHKGGRSIGTSTDPRRKSRTCDYYALRNRLLFTRRFCPLALPTIWFSLLGAFMVRLLCGRTDLALSAWRLLWGCPVVPPTGR